MATKERFPWYETIEGADLEQGDLLQNCPTIVFPPDLIWPLHANEISVGIRQFHVVILTQSCDLVNDKIEDVILCPHWSLSEVEHSSEFFKSKRGKETIRRGDVPGYHMLAAHEDEQLPLEIRVVDFHRMFSLPKTFLRNFASAQGKRLRLLPPYREHLAQAFARFFMRVGLPVDIPTFT